MQARLKRASDLVAAVLLLLLLAPVLVAVAVTIKRDSSGPVLFGQQRVGRGGRVFRMWKFRSMIVGAEHLLAGLPNEADGPLFKLRNDPRITDVGRFLRRTSLDELPQLWNVVRGDMSLVGPRPALVREVLVYDERQFGLLDVRPGITGLWQVSGRSSLSFDLYVELGLYYIERWSIGYDLEILARTIPAVRSQKGAC